MASSQRRALAIAIGALIAASARIPIMRRRMIIALGMRMAPLQRWHLPWSHFQPGSLIGLSVQVDDRCVALP
ncbi:hypothetical protein X961_5853 [Burkholderia pseudomallei MSHR5613]|nr:hypothetical protein X961_5853 [Burkholderia pseudomallei MSHR5613]